MKRFLLWTVSVAGSAVAAFFAIRAIQSGRQKMRDALGEAEAIADHTRAALEQTQSALHTARNAI